MNERDEGQGRPDQKPKTQGNEHGQESVPPRFRGPQSEQQPHGGGTNKPEPHPPKGLPTPTGWEAPFPKDQAFRSAVYISRFPNLHDEMLAIENCPPFRTRQLLRHGLISQEEARERDSSWQRHYQALSTDALNKELRYSKEMYAYNKRCAAGALSPSLTDQYNATARDFTYQILLIKQTLRQRRK